jgi:hypothetical protein
VRWPVPARPNPHLERLLRPSLPAARAFLEGCLPLGELFARIPCVAAANSTDPRWLNAFLSPLDAMSIYAAIASRRPATYLEIGSGNSTKFARRAIADLQLQTKIVSIDPHPRAEVDTICDRVMRSRLQDLEINRVTDQLSGGDVLFLDGSHRLFQNSDVAVFFMELLWSLPPGVFVGIHDIYLPFDYPQEWLDRFFSEQYVLAAILLGDQGRRITVEFPGLFAFCEGLVDEVLGDLWGRFPAGTTKIGSTFWFTRGGDSGGRMPDAA